MYTDIESIFEKYGDPKVTATLNRFQKDTAFSIAFYLNGKMIYSWTSKNRLLATLHF